jgi:hypothetical protein
MVKKHKWTNGILESFTHIFDSWEDAKSFTDNIDSNEADTLKIYDANGQLMYEATPNTADTYA